MRILFLTISFLFLFSLSHSQSGPWNNSLVICTSTDGTNFTNMHLFADSSGVPCIMRDTSGRLIAAFQWFRLPVGSATWDRVAVCFSDDDGNTWSDPTPIQIPDMPSNYVRPFDPTLVLTDDDRIRIYFSSNPNNTSIIDTFTGTFSSISDDGITYSFEPNYRFKPVGHHAIDPAVLKFNSEWHYTSPVGAAQDGAYHATSTDGLIFSQVADITSDVNHNWTGNLMSDDAAFRFYGTGAGAGVGIWWSETSDGTTWSSFNNTNIMGGDPAVIKLSANEYIMILTYFGHFTGIENNLDEDASIKIFPSPADNFCTICISPEIISSGKQNLFAAFYNVLGFEMMTERIHDMNTTVDVSNLSSGIYFVKINEQFIRFVKN